MIKEYCSYANTCIIRDNFYGSRLEKFIQFFNEAKSDFPWIEEKDVNIIHFGGQRYARTFGIEFKIPENICPDGYCEIYSLEYSL